MDRAVKSSALYIPVLEVATFKIIINNIGLMPLLAGDINKKDKKNNKVFQYFI